MLKFFILVVLLMTNYANAQYIPPEFKHFYVYEDRTLLFAMPNNNNYRAKVSANYYNIKKIIKVNEFYNALIQSGIKKSKVKEVVALILKGNSKDDKIQMEYLYEDKKVILKVNSIYMSEEKKRAIYTDVVPATKVIVMRNRLYTSSYDKNINATLSNDLIIGLGQQGFIETDVSVSSATNSDESVDLDVNNVKYEKDYEGYAVQFGYASYGDRIDNSTSLLNYSRNVNSYYINLASSDNLLALNDSEYKKLYFDLKNTGTIDILRNGKILFSRSYTKGQHSISYSSLPRGNYDVELRIRADGYTEENIIRRINNSTSKTSHKGYDYNINLRRADYEKTDYDKNGDIEQLVYGEGIYTKTYWNNELLLGVSSKSDGHSIGLGALALYNHDDISASLYYDKLLNSQYYNTSINVWGFNLNYEQLNITDPSLLTPLELVVYGQQAYQQLSFSYSFFLFSGNLSIYASKLNRESTFSNIYDGTIYEPESELFIGGIENTNFSINYQTNIYQDVSLNLGYSLNSSGKNIDQTNQIFSLNISFPLGDSPFSYFSGYDSSSQDSGKITSTIDYQNNNLNLFSGVNSSGGGSLSSYLAGPQSEISMNAQINLDSDTFNATGYVNYSNTSNSNTSMTFESTSVISSDGISQTKNFNSSYIVVKQDSILDQPDNNESTGMMYMEVNNRTYTNQPIFNGTTLIGLDKFKSYSFKIDNEITGYSSSNKTQIDTKKMFSYPGTILTMHNDIKKIVSFFSYFEDFNGNALNNIKCGGEGCISINRVGDGIYSISLIKGQPFSIVSNGSICFIESKTMQENKTQTKCFPTIKYYDGMQLVSSGLGGQNDSIYYLGELNKDTPKGIQQKLEAANIEYMEYKFGNGTHIFAKVNNNKDKKGINQRSKQGILTTLIQRNIIIELLSYIKDHNKEQNEFALIGGAPSKSN